MVKRKENNTVPKLTVQFFICSAQKFIKYIPRISVNTFHTLHIHVDIHTQHAHCIHTLPATYIHLPSFSPLSLLLDSQVFWGQEHYNCLSLIQEYLQSYLKEVESQAEEDKEIPIPSQQSLSLSSRSHHTEHSSDDLRTGIFRYIQGSGTLFLSMDWKEGGGVKYTINSGQGSLMHYSAIAIWKLVWVSLYWVSWSLIFHRFSEAARCAWSNVL